MGERDRPRKGTSRPAAGRDTRRNYRLLVEYDGGRYSGFQIQPAARTIAGELAGAIASVIGGPVTLIGAGRTDAGVHAEGQVVNFLSAREMAPGQLVDELNERLPADINVLSAALAAPGFHARSQARSRTYRYQVSTRRDAFRKRTVWWVRSPLDRDRLVAEAAAIAGFHDFASFTDATPEDTTLRVFAASWRGEGSLLLFHVTAERFLYRLVRRLVGAMIEVGLHRERPGLVARLLAQPVPGKAAPLTAPPSGLLLERVDYSVRSTSILPANDQS